MEDPKQACYDHHQRSSAGASTSADIPGPQGSRANDQETLTRRKLDKSCAEKVKGTEDEVDVETERPRWTERSVSNAEPADQINPVQRSSWCDPQAEAWVDRGKGESGVRAQTSIAIPPLFVTDARCSTTGGGVQGIGQRQVGHRLENDSDVARRECGTVIISIESITDV